MNPSIDQAACSSYQGSHLGYQDHVASKLEDYGVSVPRWSWVTTKCHTDECTRIDHLVVHSPVKIYYPSGVCIYCGRHAGTKDHLLPRPWSGDTARQFVATVPACGTCNSLLGATITVSITERRLIAHRRIRKKFAKVLRTPDYTPEQIDEFEGSLREFVLDAMDKKAEVLRMLAWPDDPAYDMRAMERSGIDDPYAVGLIQSVLDDETLAYVRAVA